MLSVFGGWSQRTFILLFALWNNREVLLHFLTRLWSNLCCNRTQSSRMLGMWDKLLCTMTSLSLTYPCWRSLRWRSFSSFKLTELHGHITRISIFHLKSVEDLYWNCILKCLMNWHCILTNFMIDLLWYKLRVEQKFLLWCLDWAYVWITITKVA